MRNGSFEGQWCPGRSSCSSVSRLDVLARYTASKCCSTCCVSGVKNSAENASRISVQVGRFVWWRCGFFQRICHQRVLSIEYLYIRLTDPSRWQAFPNGLLKENLARAGSIVPFKVRITCLLRHRSRVITTSPHDNLRQEHQSSQQVRVEC